MTNRAVIQRPLGEMKAHKYADAIVYTLDALSYPGLSAYEQYFLYLLIIEAYLRLRDYDLAEYNVQAVKQLTSSKKLLLQYDLLRAELDICQQRYESALQALSDVEFEAYQVGIGQARMVQCKYLKGVAMLRQGLPKLALDSFNYALGLAYDRLNRLICEAYIASVLQNIDDLQRAASGLLEQFPCYPGLTQLCGNLSILLGNDPRSIIFAEKCVEFAEVFGQPTQAYLLASTYARFGLFDKAEQVLKANGNAYTLECALISNQQYLEALQSNSTGLQTQALMRSACGSTDALLDIDELLKSQSTPERITAAQCFLLLGQPGKTIRILQGLPQAPYGSQQRLAVCTTLSSALSRQEKPMEAYFAALAGQAECLLLYGRGFLWAETAILGVQALMKLYGKVKSEAILRHISLSVVEIERTVGTSSQTELGESVAACKRWLSYHY